MNNSSLEETKQQERKKNRAGEDERSDGTRSQWFQPRMRTRMWMKKELFPRNHFTFQRGTFNKRLFFL